MTLREEEFRERAEAHWKYVEQVIRLHGESEMVIQKIGFHYKTAIIHGYGHGYEDKEDEE